MRVGYSKLFSHPKGRHQRSFSVHKLKKIYRGGSLFKSSLGSILRAKLMSKSSGLTHNVNLNRYSVSYSAPRRFARFYSSKPGEIITVPLKMGIDSVKSGEVSKINFNVGDAVKMDDAVIVVDTDKIAYELKAPESGVITKIHTKLNSVIEEGAIAFDLKVGEQSEAKPSSQSKTPPPVTEKKEEKKPLNVEKPKPSAPVAEKKEEKKQESTSPQPTISVSERVETRQKMKKN